MSSRRAAVWLLVFLALAVAGGGLDLWGDNPGDDSGLSGASVGGRVVRVVDGDTVRVRLRDSTRDRPLHRRRHARDRETREPVQCFGKPASEFNRRLVAGRMVRLRFGPERRDRYGRLLAYVYLPGRAAPLGQRATDRRRLRARADDRAQQRAQDPLRPARERARGRRGLGALWAPAAARRLEAQQRADRAQCLEIGVVAHEHDLGGLGERALDRRLEHVVALPELLTGRRAARLGREEVRRGRGVALGVEALLDQQRLDAPLVERVQRVGEAGDAARVAARARSAAGPAIRARAASRPRSITPATSLGDLGRGRARRRCRSSRRCARSGSCAGATRSRRAARRACR